jgi:hypothetical protein
MGLSRYLRYMAMGGKTATLNLRIDPAVKAAADRAAREDNRSLTSLVELLLIVHLRERGLWPKPKR